MTVTIELAPELEQQLRQAAARQGQDPVEFLSTFVKTAVEEKLQNVPDMRNGQAAEHLTLEDEEHLLDELATNGDSLPVLPPEANSREWIYGDHG